jgi:hypothetical protein
MLAPITGVPSERPLTPRTDGPFSLCHRRWHLASEEPDPAGMPPFVAPREDVRFRPVVERQVRSVAAEFGS